MKNSLFKRAFAAAAAVPLALTQCLTVANAASINNADIAAVANETVAADNSVTLNGEGGLVYITPGKEADGNDYYTKSGDDANGYTFVKDSTWNETVLGKLTSVKKKSGTIDASDLFDEIVKRSGNYADKVQGIFDKTSEISYTISEDGDITLTATVDDLAPGICTKNRKNTIGGAMNALADKYGAPELKDKSIFNGIVAKGKFELVIKGSSLDDTKVEATLVFTDETNKEWKGSGVADYSLAKLALMKSTAKAAVDANAAKYGIDTADAYAQIDDSVAFYEKQLKRVNKAVDKAQAKTTEEKSYGSVDELIAAAKANSYAQKAENEFNFSIPGTVDEAVANDTIKNNYAKLINKINENAGYTVDISLGELGDFAKSFENIKAQLLGGSATLYAEFNDDENDAVAEYFMQEYGLKVVKSYKTVDVTADYSKVKDAQGGEASVDLQMKRIVEAVTTTTTTSTSTTTTTSTSTSTTETTDTTTSSTETTDTTTSSTETTDTTTTTTETGTTTKAVRKNVTNYTVAAKPGFYLNIDKEFKKDQIESITVRYDDSYVFMNEADEILGTETINQGTPINITDKVSFGDQTPANVFVDGDYQFSHLINLYATEDILDGARVIVNSGDKLVQGNGREVTVVAYVGVKGDGDLNYKAEAKDASLVLRWYAKMSTMGPDEDVSEVVFSNSNLITDNEAGERVVKENYDKTLDDFALFLCDVDNENDPNNWNELKPARKVQAIDASFILVMYSKASTGVEPNRESWNAILGDSAKAEVINDTVQAG